MQVSTRKTVSVWRRTRSFMLPALAAALWIAGPVGAQSVNGLIGSPVAEVFASDENREDLINRVGQNPNIIDEGDSLSGIFYFDQFKVNGGPTTSLEHGQGNSEWTGIFQIAVTSKTATGIPEVPYRFEFGPDPAFEADYGTGTVAVFWEDFAPPANASTFDVDDVSDPSSNGPDQIDAEASVTDGTFYWTLGFARDENAWTGLGGDDITAVGNPSDRLASGTFALDRTGETFSANGLGADYELADLTNPAGTGEFIGTVNIGGPTVDSPWPLSSNINANFTVIPEPATLALIGLSGIVMMPRRFRRES